MGAGSDGYDLWELHADDRNCGFDIRPWPSVFPIRNVREFVQDLNAYDSARGQGIERALALFEIEKGVNENIRVEERPHRSFASSRSNL